MDKYPKYISQEQQERFEGYLLGELPDEEQKRLENALRDDPKLQEEFEEFKALFQTVEEVGMRAKLEEFHSALAQDTEPVRQLRPTQRKFNYRIAASVAILLALGGFWFFNRIAPNEKLFQEYYSPDPGLPTVMGSSDNYAFYEAMVDYKQGNYDVAIAKWEKLQAKKPENDTLNYFLGSAHLGNKDLTLALPYFQKTVGSGNTPFNSEAYYYMGLIALKSGEGKKALGYFELSDLTKAQELAQTLRQNAP